MTRGRDSTVAHARSPRLAITLRGLKILEHPKTKPELWGVVVPWVRVQTVGQDGAATSVRLIGEDGRMIPQGTWASWSIGSMGAGYIIKRMVERARRNVLRTGEFDIVDEERVTTAGRAGLTFLAAMFLGMFGVFGIYFPGLVLQGFGQNPFWISAVCAGLAAVMFVVSALFFGGMAWLWVRVGWFTAHSVRVTGVQIEITTQDGRVHTHAWHDVRRMRPEFVHIVLWLNDGRKLLLMPGRSRFVFHAMIRRQDPAAAERDTERAMVRKAFWWFQGGGVLVAAIVAWINAAGLGPLPHHPLAYYAIVGFAMPAVMAFGAVGPNAIAKWDAARLRRNRSRNRSKSRERAPANPAG